VAPPAVPLWLDELPLKPGPPWLSMGLHPLDLDTWLVLDSRSEAELALKAQLLDERHDDVFQALPGSEEGGTEVLELVEAWLTTHRGALTAEPVPQRSPRGEVYGTGSGVGAVGGLHPLDMAGRLVQEDLCLMARDGERYVLVAASVCFPSHWRLSEKMGRPVAQIHAPVAHYDHELEARVDHFFERLRVDRPVVRRNLSIHNHDELFRPEPHESPRSFAPDPSGLDQVWLRSERQTLVRLPRTSAVLFTIKTQHCPASVLTQRPDIARALATKLAAEEPEMARTGETIPFPTWFVAWLNSL
jgi:dimethylamine monooxygenase subunit A